MIYITKGNYQSFRVPYTYLISTFFVIDALLIILLYIYNLHTYRTVQVSQDTPDMGFQLSICTCVCVLGSIPGLSKYPRILRTWVFNYTYVHVYVYLGVSRDCRSIPGYSGHGFSTIHMYQEVYVYLGVSRDCPSIPGYSGHGFQISIHP